MRQWMNDRHRTRHIEAGCRCRRHGHLTDSSNHRQQHLAATEAGAPELCRNVPRHDHHIREIQTRMSEVVDSNDGYAVFDR